MHGAQVQSLVGELSSHMPQWPKKKTLQTLTSFYIWGLPSLRTEVGGPEAQKRRNVQVPPQEGSSCSELADYLWVGL